MNKIIIIVALILITVNLSYAQSGNWVKVSSAGPFTSTVGFDTSMYAAATANGHIYTGDFRSDEVTHCVTLPTGTTVKSLSTSYGELGCYIFATTGNGKVYKINTCNCTYVLWSTIPSYSAGLNAMAWKNGTTAFLCGEDGKIFRTTTDGLSWTQQNTGVNVFLNDVEVLSDTVVITAVGDGGIIIKSTNNGDNWTNVPSGTTEWLDEINVINQNPSTFLISGSGGVLSTWNGINSPVPFTTGTNLGFIGYDNFPPLPMYLPLVGINVGDNGSYSFIYTGIAPGTYSLSLIQQMYNYTNEYLVSVAAGLKKKDSKSGAAFDSLVAIAAGNTGLFRYTEAIIPSAIKEAPLVVSSFGLSQNYPNPFNPSTVISYQLPVKSFVSLKLYDVTGVEVATLVNEEKEAGVHNYELRILNSELVSGVYFYQMVASEFVSTKKLVVMK